MSKLIKITSVLGLGLIALGVLKIELPYSVRKVLPDFVNYFIFIGIVFVAISFFIYIIKLFKNHNSNTLKFSKIVFYTGIILVVLKIIREIGLFGLSDNYGILLILIVISFPILIAGLLLLVTNYILLKNYRALSILGGIFVITFFFLPIVKVSYNCGAGVGYPIEDNINGNNQYPKEYHVGSCPPKWKTPYMYTNNFIRFGYQQ